MMAVKDAVLLRIYLAEAAKWEHRPLYEAVVLRAREAGLAGATVLRGSMGYGHSSHLHTAKILDLSMNLPLVIEIVDDEAKVTAFLELAGDIVKGALVTLEKVKVMGDGARPA